MTTDLVLLIARIRRAMPRNADVMALCDAVEPTLMMAAQAELLRAQSKLQGDAQAACRDGLRDLGAKPTKALAALLQKK